MRADFSVVDAIATFDTNDRVMCGVNDESVTVKERVGICV
jgi:hypothetical protein